MASNPTFGCGAFLPGEGPGNFTQFDGGGIIDSGGGGGDDPPIQTDPNEQTEACACIPNSDYTQTIQFDGPFAAIVTRTYSQTCTTFDNSSDAAAAASAARINIRNQAPPLGVGWSADGSVQILGGPIGANCKNPNGTCGAACPDIIVISRWRRSISPGGATPGSTGGSPGPIAGPPPAPTTPPPPGISDIPPAPTTPPPPRPRPGGEQETFPCACIVESLEPGPKKFIGLDSKGCITWRVEWRYTCRERRPGDPLVGANPHLNWPVTSSPGFTVTGTPKRTGPRSAACGGSSPCSRAECAKSSVEWVECPDGGGDPPGPGGGGVTPGPDAGAGPPPSRPGITPGPDAGAGPPPTMPPGPGGGGITPGPDLGDDDNRPGVSTGGDLPTTPPPVLIPGNAPPTPAGEGLTYRSSLGSGRLEQSINTRNIDLNDPNIIREVLKLKPNGIQESSIEFSKTAKAPTQVYNDTEFTGLFNTKIDSNIYYVLKNTNSVKNWDSTKAAGVTIDAIMSSLRPEIIDILNKIRNYDGTKLSQRQIFSMIGSRILDGSIGEITKPFLQSLADDSERRIPTTITRSSIEKVNEVAALILIDQNKIPLDVSKIIGKEKQIFKNFKVLSSDIDKFIPVTIEGITKRFYINDDDTFIDRSTLSISDGDYFDITSGGKVRRLFTESEKDHAFLLPESTRQKVITLLGGDSGRTLSVSGDEEISPSIEYDYSLSTPRQPFYVLSAVLSSIETSPNSGGSFLLKDTSLRYQLMDTSSDAGLSATNEFIKYKANKRIFVLDHEDLIIDYMERTGSINLKQTDVIFNSPKINKTIPLLVRQIPFYIMIYPTNRSEYNIFNDKSRIVGISNNGSVTRELRCKTHINPEFTDPQTNKFIKYSLVGKEATDVLGTSDTQTRISLINPNDEIFKTAFKKGNTLVPASEYDVDRPKTGFRLLREIIQELDTNYVLSLNGVGKTLTEFDAFSRLTLKQFNILSRLENFSEISRAISNGLINDVKLIPPIENADTRIVINQTQLVQRKSTAGDDSFKPIKATGKGVTIVSPDTDGVGGFEPAT